MPARESVCDSPNCATWSLEEENMARFVCSPLSGDLCEVPGVSANVQSVFHEHGIQTSFQLIEKYASLKEDGVSYSCIAFVSASYKKFLYLYFTLPLKLNFVI